MCWKGAAWEKKIADMQAALSDERADFDRVMTERTEHLAKVREALEQQAADLEKRLKDFDARRTAFEAVVFEKQKEVAANPELPVLEEVTVDADDTPSPDFPGMFAPLDATPAQKAKEKSRPRWVVPVAIAGVVVALGAAVAGGRYENEGRGARALATRKTAVSTVSDPLPEGAPQRRGGFLSQTAAGTLSQKAFAPVQPYATAADSAARRAAADSAADTAAKVEAATEEPRPRPRPKPVERETERVEPSSSIFSLPSRRMIDTVLRRDSVRPDSIKRDAVRRDTTRVPIDTTFRIDTSFTKR